MSFAEMLANAYQRHMQNVAFSNSKETAFVEWFANLGMNIFANCIQHRLAGWFSNIAVAARLNIHDVVLRAYTITTAIELHMTRFAVFKNHINHRP